MLFVLFIVNMRRESTIALFVKTTLLDSAQDGCFNKFEVGSHQK